MMTNLGLGGYKSIRRYVNAKIGKLLASEKTFESLYGLMFSESENVFCERTDGHRTVKTTYGEAKLKADGLAAVVSGKIDAPENSIVGLYADNSEAWIEALWAILKCGYRPLLMNKRLGLDRLNEIISLYSVAAVISDGDGFPVPTFILSELVSEIGKTDGTLSGRQWADELIVMSSGTSENVKLCGYTGENFAYQILDSANIIKQSKQIKKHYDGSLKLLTFLPLYHIFGLAATYMWFGFFSRTFVFLKNLDPDTILYTIKKHKVTHIFAVPLLWNKVYEGLYKKLNERGKKTVEKFEKGLKIANKTGSALFSKLAFKEVRDNLFGDSVRFMITGGGAISPKVISLFNAVGYPLFNGYGMSEIGITSVELSEKQKVRSLGSVGKPFSHVTYSIEDGELFVSGKAAATRIWESGKEIPLNGQKYPTRDLVKEVNGRYYVLGRKDDLIVDESGENINPDNVESRMNIVGAGEKAILRSEKDGTTAPVLVISMSRFSSAEKRKAVLEEARSELIRLNLASQIKTVVLVSDKLLSDDEFKLNRRRLSKAYDEGTLSVLSEDPDDIVREASELAADLRREFAKALNKDEADIGDDMHFFFDLGGGSLDYFALISEIKRKYGVAFPISGGESLSTVREFCDFIRSHS